MSDRKAYLRSLLKLAEEDPYYRGTGWDELVMLAVQFGCTAYPRPTAEEFSRDWRELIPLSAMVKRAEDILGQYDRCAEWAAAEDNNLDDIQRLAEVSTNVIEDYRWLIERLKSEMPGV